MKDSVVIIIGVGILTGINGLVGDFHLKKTEKKILDTLESHATIESRGEQQWHA